MSSQKMVHQPAIVKDITQVQLVFTLSAFKKDYTGLIGIYTIEHQL